MGTFKTIGKPGVTNKNITQFGYSKSEFVKATSCPVQIPDRQIVIFSDSEGANYPAGGIFPASFTAWDSENVKIYISGWSVTAAAGETSTCEYIDDREISVFTTVNYRDNGQTREIFEAESSKGIGTVSAGFPPLLLNDTTRFPQDATERLVIGGGLKADQTTGYWKLTIRFNLIYKRD